jgi:hypothetical protein
MPARFILSLDCEGKWGVTHHLGAREHRTLTDANLRRAYRSIIDLLDDFDLSATFAFVGLFGESNSSFKRLRPAVENLALKAPTYIKPALLDIDSGSGEGWHGEWAVSLVENASVQHEIALQGVTHVPWDQMTDAFVADEMAIYRELTGPVRNSRTMVYPRNRVAHTRLLPEYGIEGYRMAPCPRSRARSLAAEFNLFAKSEQDSAWSGEGAVAIPAGYFVNWQSGLRRLVPIAVSEKRFAKLLANAEMIDGLVHFWLHPENVASAPATLDLLRMMARHVARARETGHCTVLTQASYCQSMIDRRNWSKNPAALTLIQQS